MDADHDHDNENVDRIVEDEIVGRKNAGNEILETYVDREDYLNVEDCLLLNPQVFLHKYYPEYLL